MKYTIVLLTMLLSLNTFAIKGFFAYKLNGDMPEELKAKNGHGVTADNDMLWRLLPFNEYYGDAFRIKDKGAKADRPMNYDERMDKLAERKLQLQYDGYAIVECEDMDNCKELKEIDAKFKAQEKEWLPKRLVK